MFLAPPLRPMSVAVMCALLLFACSSGAFPRDIGSAAAANVMYFHGTVTKVDATYVTVSRSLVGRAPESHTFLTNKRTKLNRSLRLRANVTVRYQRLPEGDIALDIQVHTSSYHLQFSDPSNDTGNAE